MSFLNCVGSWLLSAGTATVLGSLVSTQFVIADLRKIGVSVDLENRLSMSAQDIIGLGPLYFVIIAIGYVIAFFTAEGIHRLIKSYRPLVFTLAGAFAIATALVLMENVFFGVPLISGARSGFGFLMQIISGAAGGYLFARLTDKGHHNETS